MMKMSVKVYQNTMFALILAALHMGCTASQPQSKVTIQLPVLSKQVSTLEFEDTDNLEGTWRGTATSADQINCYVVMIGGESEELKRNQCYKRDSKETAVQFGQFIGGVASGNTVDLELPAGVPRRMILIGMHAQDGTCRDFTKDGPEEGMLSHPRVLYDNVHKFESGSQALQMKIPADLTGLAEIDECKIDGRTDDEEPDDDNLNPPGPLQVGGWEIPDTVYGTSNKLLGHVVASSDNMFVVGAPGTGLSTLVTGEVHVYTWNRVTWVRETLQLPTDLSANSKAQFGYSVDTDGDSIIVGAPRAFAGNGSVYIYQKNPVTQLWSGTQPTLSLQGSSGERLGLSVALQGKLAVAGATYNAFNNTVSDVETGRIVYFKKVNDTWAGSVGESLVPSDLATLPANLNEGADRGFGRSVSISPNERFLAVGAPYFETSDDREAEGVVFVLEFDKATNRIGEHIVQAASTITNAQASGLQLGLNVKISNSTLVSGNHEYYGDGNPETGSVLVSRIAGRSWTNPANFLEPLGVPADYSEAGAGLAVLGDLIVVGFREGSSVAGTSGCGYFNLYKYNTVERQWAQQGESQGPNVCQTGSRFAGALTINKDFIGVGAPQAKDSVNGGVGQGSISIFTPE